jgi:predicted PurR-regulated permease PerM
LQQAFAAILPQIGRRATFTVTFLLFTSLVILVVSVVQFAQVLKGKEVKDVSDSLLFLDTDPRPVSKDEVALKLMSEYAYARKNHEQLVRERLSTLFRAMWFLGSAMVIAFIAILIAFVSASIHKKPLMINAVPSYNTDVASKPTSQTPPPTVLPKPGGGTTMIKGGGGNGK